MITDNLQEMLETAVARINRPEFALNDPVQFPRRFSAATDIEIVSLLISHIAWGKREMICRDSERLLDILGDSPTDFVLRGPIDEIEPERNIHRTFFGRDLIYFLRGLRHVYKRYGSLEAFGAAIGIGESEFPSWKLAEGLNKAMAEASEGSFKSIRCLPANLESTALKRLNMALRWLVRRDGIVDMGIWNVITPAQLYIPLDVHVADTSRSLGLLTRAGNDRKAVVQLTGALRRFDPADPVKYDFALFGIGIGDKA